MLDFLLTILHRLLQSSQVTYEVGIIIFVTDREIEAKRLNSVTIFMDFRAIK